MYVSIKGGNKERSGHKDLINYEWGQEDGFPEDSLNPPRHAWIVRPQVGSLRSPTTKGYARANSSVSTTAVLLSLPTATAFL